MTGKRTDWEVLDRGILGMAARNVRTGQIVTGDIVNDLVHGGPVKRLANLLRIQKDAVAKYGPGWKPGETFSLTLARARRRAVTVQRRLRRG